MAAPLRAPRMSREVRFAEELGVTTVHEQAEGVAESIATLMTTVQTEEQNVRAYEERATDRKWEITLNLRAEQKDGGFKSLAAEERAVAEALTQDESYVQALQSLAERRDDLREATDELRLKELEHRRLIGRMGTLASYLNYLAACKNARTTALAESYPV